MTASMRRFLVMCGGNLILGLGICLFKLSIMGNDPFTAFVLALSAKMGVLYALVTILVNSVFFIGEIFLGRKYIGIGTFVNWFSVGYIILFFEWVICGIWTIPEGFFPRLLIMGAGILVLSFGVSLYQTADMGIAPYDSISVIMSERLPFSYFWCRIFTDACCAVGAWAFGGLVGLGTLVCALGLGPFIQFFTVHFAEPICNGKISR